MSILRARLAETDPTLSAALERSWHVALEEWLPAIPPSLDSFNSYPHLRNVENHIDQVLLAAESLSNSLSPPKLRAVEMYLLLASVLFHDFGRTQSSSDHAPVSQRKILGQYGSLGIPSQELAKCLAAISLAHDPPVGSYSNLLYDVVIDPYGEVRLRALRALLVLGDHMDGAFNRVAPPYVKTSSDLGIVGMFRRHVRGVYADCTSQMIRVVLTDMEPSSSVPTSAAETGRETLPLDWKAHYSFIDPSEIEDVLREFGFDKPIHRLIKKELLRGAKSRVEAAYGSFPNDKARTLLLENDYSSVLPFLKRQRNGSRPGQDNLAVYKRIVEWFTRLGGPLSNSPLWQLLPNSAPETKYYPRALLSRLPDKSVFNVFSLWDWMVVMNLLDVRLEPSAPESDKGYDRTWPHAAVLAVLMRDADYNRDTLLGIREDLAAFGVPLRAWLLEHREHLYTPLGLETYEPVLHKDFLKRVAEAMWSLTLGIFGSSRFTYEELAAQAREPNVTRVRLAVRRLSIIGRCEFFEAQGKGNSSRFSKPSRLRTYFHADQDANAIWAGDGQWRWSTPFASCPQCEQCLHSNLCWRSTKCGLCGSCSGLQNLTALIDKLQPPVT